MKLKTIEEHNAEVLDSFKERNNTGVACPNCDNELQFADSMILLSYPAQKKVVCFECNYTTNIFVKKGYR